MKSYLLAALLISAAPALAQTSITTLPPPAVDNPKVAALRDNALDNDHYAWDIVEGLTTEVGQRLAATEAEARARDWAVKRLTAMGFANVHVEPFDMPVWARGAESAEIVSPFPQKLAVAALGYSGSTGPRASPAKSSISRVLDALRARPTARSKARSCSSTTTWSRPRTARGTASSARRAARGRPSPRSKARSASSSARLAPTIIATRTRACNISPTARPRSRPVRSLCLTPSTGSDAQARAAGGRCI